MIRFSMRLQPPICGGGDERDPLSCQVQHAGMADSQQQRASHSIIAPEPQTNHKATATYLEVTSLGSR